MEFIIKTIIGGLIIATVSTVSEKNPTLGAFILGIPLASFVSLIFMHYAGVDVQSFKTLSYQTIYFVLISLLFFPIFAAPKIVKDWTNCRDSLDDGKKFSPITSARIPTKEKS